MYDFSYFRENDRAVILHFLEKNPFAFLTGSTRDGQQVATQIPILFEEREGQLYLQGHIMRKTDHHKAFIENPRALVVFTGPHTYVSGSWYSNPQIASTWNYMSVHIHGNMKFLNDEELIDLMKKLTLKFEKGDAASPTIYDNLPQPFLQKMLPAIVGFEMRAEEIKNVFKLSQNRDEKSYRTIIKNLEEVQEQGNAALIADEMKARLQDLFPPGVEWDGSRFSS